MMINPTYVNRVLCLTLFLLMANNLYSQEICDNGVDDDADGLIDLNDIEDCNCGEIVNDILIQGDFEEYTCCPNNVTSIGTMGIECLDDGWGPASDGTSDYYNTCGFMGGGAVSPIPVPIPSGNGAVGIVSNASYYETVGTCLGTETLEAGGDYELSFYLGVNDEVLPSDTSIGLTLFGTADCANFPLVGDGFSSSCLTEDSNWEELVTFTAIADSSYSWTYIEANFAPSFDVAAIAIGHECVLSGVSFQYHFFDDIQIVGETTDEEEGEEISSNGDCISGVVLEVPAVAGGTYQWYLDGVAIVGATSLIYEIPDASQEGVYEMVVTTFDGCTVSPPFFVQIDPDILQVEGEIMPIQCAELENGSINITPESNNSPFDIMWSDGSMEEDLSNIGEGDYTVTVTDAYGCIGTATYTLSNPDSIEIATFGDCITGTSVQVADGLPNPNYQWYLDGVAIDGATSNPYNIPSDESGEYYVVVTDDSGLSCLISYTEDVFIETQVLNIAGAPEQILCYGDSSGAISIGVTEINPPYTFEWSNGQSDQEIFNLGPGEYTVTVTDANGCSATETFYLTDPPVFQNVLTVVQSENGTPASAEISSVGGTMPYTYLWSNGETTNPILNVPAGNYSVTITDANGCFEIFDFQILSDYTVLEEYTDTICAGTCSASIRLSIIEGAGDYSIEWPNSPLEGFMVDNVCAGSYDYTILDENDTPYFGTIIIDEWPLVEINGLVQDTLCTSKDSVLIMTSLTGGTPPYSYLWDDGTMVENYYAGDTGTYGVLVTDIKGCTSYETFSVYAFEPIIIQADVTNSNCNGAAVGGIDLTISGEGSPYSFLWESGEITEDLDSLIEGSYAVTVTGINGCVLVDSFLVGSNAGLTILDAVVNNNCQGDTTAYIEVEVSGGIPPYTYMWSTGDTTNVIQDLADGVYDLTISDNAGCTLEMNYSISTNSENGLIVFTEDNECFEGVMGSIHLFQENSSALYDVQWSNGDSTFLISDLSAGEYSYEVVDTFGCLYTDTITIFEEQELIYESMTIEPNCNGAEDGQISITIVSGNQPVSYLWSNGIETSSNENISAGIYLLTITDSNGCELLDTFTLSEQSELSIIDSITHVFCYGEENGAIDITVSGGDVPYTFLWDNGVMQEDLTNVAAGLYGVEVIDNSNCRLTALFEVFEPDSIEVTSVIVDPICHDAQGIISVMASGGVGPYIYGWNPENVTDTIVTDPGNTYTLFVRDENQCTKKVEYYVPEIDSIQIILEEIINAGPSDDDGSIEVNAIGGTGPYDYLWDNGQSGAIVTGLSNGTHTVTVTDMNGCEAISIFILSSEILTFNFEFENNVCFGECLAFIDLEINGGTLPYTVSWSDGQSTSEIENLCDGIYVATITDGVGTELITEPFFIQSPDQIILEGTAYDISCFGQADGAVSVSGTGGTEPFDFDWSNQLTGDSITNLSSGEYIVTVVDDNGCTESELFTVDDIELIEVTVDIVQPSCDESTGVLILSTDFASDYDYILNDQIYPIDEYERIDNLDPGNYDLFYSISESCFVFVDEFRIDTYTPLNIQLNTSEVEVVEGDNYTFDIIADSLYTAQSIEWTTLNDYDCTTADDNGNCTTIILQINVEEELSVIVTDQDGCETELFASIRILNPSTEIFVPNIFSPNDDGLNDEIIIYSSDEDVIIQSFSIYDRWGNQIYHLENLPVSQFKSWDGTYNSREVNPGVFVYRLDVTVGEKFKRIYGDITVLR